MHQLIAALCLVLVIESLLLFVAPKAWQAMVRQALALPPRTLRLFGAGATAIGHRPSAWCCCGVSIDAHRGPARMREVFSRFPRGINAE